MEALASLSSRGHRVDPFRFAEPPVPVVYNFDQGLPAHETFPLADLSRLAVEVLAADGGWALEYISFEPQPGGGHRTEYPEIVLGSRALRAELAAWLGGVNRRDLGAENLILTAGAVQGVALAADAFVDPGDGVIVEQWTFPYASRYLRMAGAEVASVPLDADGIDVAALERRLISMRDAGTPVKLLYCIPTFQLPTGVCTSLPRRRRILELAAEFDFLVLEDAIYADLRFEGEPIPSLLALDREARVMQVHGFSKVIAPGLRIGWVAAAPALVECLARVRTDLGVSQWTARTMAAYLREGLLAPHIREANMNYRRRRDVAVAAVREHCGEWARFEVPAGGFYLWLELDRGIEWRRALELAAARGVLCRPGDLFGAGECSFLRLAYSHAPLEEIPGGIAALAAAVAEAAA